MGLKPRAITLHIEELVLEGFAGDSRRIGDAVQRELTRLIGERGLGDVGGVAGEVERLDGGMFRVAPGASARNIGTQLAEAIHRPLGAQGSGK